MERGPSRNSREQIRKGSLRSSSMYGAAQDNNVLESSGRDEINESQLEPRITEKKYVVPKLGGNANTSGGLITIHTPHRGYGGGTPRILLTTRALRQHNIQQENISQQKQIIAMKPIKVSDREIFVAYGDGTGDRIDHLVEARFYTERQKHIRKTLSNKANRSATDQEASGNPGSYFGVEVDAMDRLGEVMVDVHLSYWDTETAYELTAWGNDLAGVGEHVTDHTYEEYARHEKLVVDQ